MTKIAIISQPEQGVLIDIGGCDSLHEATQHLSSTFQVTNEFWQDQHVDLNLGNLRLNKDELAQVLAILSERGVNTRQFFSDEETTRAALRAHDLEPAAPPTASEAAQAAEGLGSWAEAAAAAAAAARAATTDGAAEPGGVATEAPAAATDVKETSEQAAEVGASACTTVTEQTEAAETTEAAEAAEAAKPAAPAIPHVLYLRQTLRSGQSVSHKGHLVIIGDVNPGAEVSAEGDITIWGALRGIAHAGTAGNTNCEIRALKFDPIQLRIAHSIARAPDRPRGALRSSGPETARIVNGTIRISSSAPD